MIETVPTGTVLHGRYRIERVLGSGGFGHVYLVQDLTTNQQFALKEYLVSGPGGQEQLMHEANVLSHLHHPNIPAFQDAFNERGRYYVVINYIEGEDLTDIIRITQRRNEAVPLLQLLNWMLETCDAVIFLHNQHPPVIHRDIKPDNIRIMRNGTAILVDLGNAKAYADGLRTLLFIRHQGTPGYAPPEQYPGGSGTDARSDVYALGATLYFAITAHEPPSVSVRNQALQQGQPDLPSLQQVLAQNPAVDSPAAAAPKQFRLGVSKPAKPAPKHSNHIAQLATLSLPAIGQLNTILQRSMALRPKDRYQHVADFAHDLQQVRDLIVAETQAKPNPFSTQPDLPQLYEAIQNARMVESAEAQAMPKTPTPVARNNAGAHCPQCNATLMANAPFCPNCGLVFTTPVKKSTDQPVPDNMPVVVKGISSQRPVRSTDQVVTATTQSPQSPQTPNVQDVPQQDFPERKTTPNSPWSTTPVTPQDSVARPRRAISPTPQQMVQRPAPAQQASSGFNVSTGLIVAVLIALLILIILMIVLIASHIGLHSLPNVVVASLPARLL